MTLVIISRIQAFARRLLGIADYAQLIAGQRADHDALAEAIRLKVEVEQKAARGLSQVATLTQSVHNRLAFYERNVPPVQRAAKVLVERMLRDERKAKAAAELAAAPSVERPEMSEEVASG